MIICKEMKFCEFFSLKSKIIRSVQVHHIHQNPQEKKPTMELVQVNAQNISQLPSAEVIAGNPKSKYVVGLVAKVMCFYRDPKWVRLRPGVLVVSDYTVNDQLMESRNTPNEYVTNNLVVSKNALFSVSVPHSLEDKVNQTINQAVQHIRPDFDYEKFNSCLVHKADLWVYITVHLKLYEGKIEGILMDDMSLAPSNLEKEKPVHRPHVKTNDFIYEPQFLDDDAEPLDDIEDSTRQESGKVEVSDLVKRYEDSDDGLGEEINISGGRYGEEGPEEPRQSKRTIEKDQAAQQTGTTDQTKDAYTPTSTAEITTGSKTERYFDNAETVKNNGPKGPTSIPDPSIFVPKYPTSTKIQLHQLDLDTADDRVYEVVGWVRAFHPIPFLVRPFAKTARAMPIKIFLGSDGSGGMTVQTEVVQDDHLAMFWGVAEIEAVVAQLDLLEAQAQMLLGKRISVRMRKSSLVVAGAQRAYWRVVSSVAEMRATTEVGYNEDDEE